jgi:hypothetical protein
MVTADVTILTRVARGREPFGFVCTERMAASVPCPSASGASPNTSTPETSPPSATTSGIAQGRAKPLAAWMPPSPAVVAGV